MSKKIKLTDKDLELNVKSSDYNANYSRAYNTQVPQCPTTTLGLNCQTATFRTVCMSKEPSCDCGIPDTNRLNCYDTGNNCMEPYTLGASCEGCITLNCPQPGTGDIVCESDDCVVSDECVETFDCILSEIDCETVRTECTSGNIDCRIQ